MKSLKNNIYFKVGTIVLIVLLLLIPTSMIKQLIHEREYTQQRAITEVSSKWGEEQTLTGPFLTIPYIEYIKKFDEADSSYKHVPIKRYAHLLPSVLMIDGDIQPEKRYRGIYEIVVYNSKVDIKGAFKDLNLEGLDIPRNRILFDKARLTIGIDDLRGIEKQVDLNWEGKHFSFNPGVVTKDIVSSGINAKVAVDPEDSADYSFNFSLDLKGSQRLYFSPVGKVTDINMKSTWSNPSFNGAFLPDKREVNEEGFVANWNVLHLNRNYPQRWKGSKYKVRNSSFGIDLILPVDNYQKSYRSIKYAILFIVFTFLVFFFIEVMNKVYIHPIQYILVGIALVVFYTLLLSISEHIRYNYAFIVSALATLILIAGYVKAILKSTPLMLLISGILSILYTFIFVIIQLQDFALLIGSIGIFMILALVMYFSRKIDWYALKLGEGSVKVEE